MRKDAEEHRSRLLQAAAQVFSRAGCAVPLEAVLVEAGVGRGTLYRHFRTREDLIVAVMTGELDRMVAFVDDRKGDPLLLRDFLQEHAKVGWMAVSAMEVLGNDQARALLAPLEARAHGMYEIVIAEAVSAKLVQPPFAVDDLLLVLRMVIAAASQASTEMARSEATARALDIILVGLPLSKRI